MPPPTGSVSRLPLSTADAPWRSRFRAWDTVGSELNLFCAWPGPGDLGLRRDLQEPELAVAVRLHALLVAGVGIRGQEAVEHVAGGCR